MSHARDWRDWKRRGRDTCLRRLGRHVEYYLVCDSILNRTPFSFLSRSFSNWSGSRWWSIQPFLLRLLEENQLFFGRELLPHLPAFTRYLMLACTLWEKAAMYEERAIK